MGKVVSNFNTGNAAKVVMLHVCLFSRYAIANTANLNTGKWVGAVMRARASHQCGLSSIPAQCHNYMG